MADCCGGADVTPYPVDLPGLWPCDNYVGTVDPILEVQTPLMEWEGFADASAVIAGSVTWSPPEDPASVILTSIRPPRQRRHVGFPQGCFDDAPDCHQKLDLAIVRNWRHHAHMLWLSYEEPETQGPYLQSILPCGVRSVIEPNGDGLTPGTCIAVTDEWNIVYISGTTTFEQRVLQGATSAQGPANFGSFSTLPLWEAAAQQVIARIVAHGGPFRDKWFFAGHSYGSAIASIIAADMRLGYPEREIVLFTEGAPCPGDGRLRDILEPLKQVHLQNVGDAVCSMPPSGQLFQLVAWVLTGALRTAWAKWEPHNRRIAVSADGSYAAINEGAIEFSTLLTLAQIIAADEELPSYLAHTAGIYLERCILITD